MNSSENLCLQWNDFRDSVTNSFRTLKDDKDLTDVTLASEDGHHIEAHKVVLASSSPFFMALLQKSKHPHPLIYMRGLKSNDLTSMLNFLYVGEANVFQEDLDSFLALAEELQLKGLTGTGSGQTDNKRTEDLKDCQRDFDNHRREMSRQEERSLQTESTINKATTQNLDTTLALNGTTVIGDNQNLDKQIFSMITKSDILAGKGQGFLYICNVCGKQTPYMNMKRHVEANHITGVFHKCDLCGKTSRSKHGLLQHTTRYHSMSANSNALFPGRGTA